jgi:hypothetical protein
MISRKSTAVLVGLALLFAPVLYAHADCRNRTVLTPTADGAAIDAQGNAEARQERGRERFKVQIRAVVADGTNFFAFADGQFAGTLTTSLGFAELELESEFGTLPPELRPVCNISAVEVTDDSGTLILFGNF